MAFCVIRLRNIVKWIAILSAVEIDLAKTKTFIEGKLIIKQRERKQLDDKLDNDKITAAQWATQTDIVDEIIAYNEALIEEIQSKITDMTCERYQLQDELNDYEVEDISRALESTGIW